jgi:hypothetical protein
MKPLLDEDKIKKTNEFYEQIHRIEMDHLAYWQENTLWHWEFWVSVLFSVVPWVIWFVFRKRGSEARLLLAGLFVILIASLLDFLGVVFGIWHYSGKALPIIPSYIPWDFTLLPVTVMFWLQIKPKSNPFLKAVIFAALCAFIGEYLFEWLGLYTPKEWRSIYSFPIYIVIYLIADRISRTGAFKPLDEN